MSNVVINSFVLGGGAPAFDPTDIANLDLWQDADDSDSITESGGDVSQWDDKSVNANTPANATGAQQPTTSTVNGNVSIEFDGTSTGSLADRLRDSSGTGIVSPPATIGVVFTPTTVTSGDDGDIIRLRDGSSAVFRVRTADTDLECLEGTGGSTTILSAAGVLAVDETRWVIVRWRNSGDGTSDMLTDEDDTDSGSAAASINSSIDDIIIGANANGSDSYGGHIHEIIYYNAFITDEERTSLGDYFNSKWTLS